MPDFEVHIDLHGQTRFVGLARSNRTRGKETIGFEYASSWLEDPECFALEPSLETTIMCASQCESYIASGMPWP